MKVRICDFCKSILTDSEEEHYREISIRDESRTYPTDGGLVEYDDICDACLKRTEDFFSSITEDKTTIEYDGSIHG